MFLILFSVPDFNQSTSLLTSRLGMKSVDRVGRPTCTNQCTFGRHGTVDRPGRPGLRAELSVCLGRPGRSTGSCQRAKLTVGRSTGPVDRQCISGIFCCQRLYFSGGYKYPINSQFSLRIFCANFSLLSGVFTAIKRSF